MNQLVLFVIIIIVTLILIGIYTGENIQANNLENKLKEQREMVENFGPLIANNSDINSGSSTLYNWGITDDKKTYASRVEQESTPKTPVKPSCIPACPQSCETNVECEIRPSSSGNNHYKICRNCDITLNKDIDKYVLKSSVPPPVDMEDFARKNMVCPQINMDDYILKNDVPVCPKIDMSQYILKSDIPACPDIPQCPKCPKCPKCPAQERCKKIYEYKITEHPEFNKFVSKSDCEDAVRTAVESDNSGSSSLSSGSSSSQNTMGEQSETTGNYGMYASFTSCSPYSS